MLRCLNFIPNNNCNVWWTCFFQQTVSVPMATNCAPLLANLCNIRMKQT